VLPWQSRLVLTSCLKFHDDDTSTDQLKQLHTELGLIKTLCDYKEDDSDE
jgi:hypothetical protein